MKIVLLLNLGGPSSGQDVRLFLFRFFKDPGILNLSPFWRTALAFLISSLRAPIVAKKYAKLGGRSPQFEETEKQAQALQAICAPDTKILIAYRHASPTIEEVLQTLTPEEVTSFTFLPLYPQYAGATTGSALSAFENAWRNQGLEHIPLRKVRSFPKEKGFIEALAEDIRDRLPRLEKQGKPRLLFSAHGLPEEVIRRGDPYVEEVKQTCAALEKATGKKGILCFQSRFGFKKWTRPSLREALVEAGKEKRPVLVVPVSFVSSHIETLIELEEEERERAKALGVPAYEVCSPPGTKPVFIEALRILSERG